MVPTGLLVGSFLLAPYAPLHPALQLPAQTFGSVFFYLFITGKLSIIALTYKGRLAWAGLSEAERLRSENEAFKNERERLISGKTRRERELRKCRAIRDECAVAGRPGIAEDVYDVDVKRVGRGVGGGGGTSLKEMFNELTRKEEELVGEKRELESGLRLWEKKYKEYERVLQLGRDVSMPKNGEQCILGSRERESAAVLGENGGLISVGACGDRGSAWHGEDSKDGGTVSIACDARKKLDFGRGAWSSPLAGSSGKSPVKEDGVSQGDWSFPFVEVSDNDDDCGGPLGDEHRGRRNDEKGHKELERKRGPTSSVHGETFTQTLWALAAALKQ
ncbi:hypothetical protein NL676_010067 [Syzygium grande]|nr:hypothetical protein NL676_010067 [Syzygium grande]